MLTPWLKEEIVREHERLCLVVKQLSALEAANKAVLRAATPGSAEAKMLQLLDLKSIGPIGGQELVNEVFYRSFDNRRQVGSYFGLTGTPFTTASKASARPATGGPASLRSSSPGCGYGTSPAANSAAGSASVSATSRGGCAASPSWRWRAS
jgi:transposase